MKKAYCLVLVATFAFADTWDQTSSPAGYILPTQPAVTGNAPSKVVIGTRSTATADKMLSVYGTSGDGIKIIANSPAEASANLYFYPNSVNVDKRNWVLSAYGDSYGDFSIRNSSSGTVSPYSTTGVTRLLINKDGNVGIGRTPAAKLHVAGDVIADGGPSASFGGFQSNAAVTKWGFTQLGRFSAGVGGNVYSKGFSTNAIGIFNGATIPEDVFLYNNNSPNAGYLVLKDNGNVGIGTAKPLSMNGRQKVLEIGAIGGLSSDNPGIVLRSGAAYTLNPAWELLLSGADKNTDFQLVEGTTGRIFVSGATGNVGIGTTTTSTNRLEVNGSAKVTGQLIIGGSSTTNWLKFATNEYNSGNGAQIYQDNSGNIGFDINSTKNGMLLTHDGSLEIGQQAVFVNEKLVVAGNARITGQMETGSILTSSVTTKVWSIAPDYVFEKDYKLATLEHVEKYLDENKHLPEIPSAKDIKDKGLDLAEMNLKLLKKVEELTLYSIQQNKNAIEQSKKIAFLSERLSRVEKERK